MPGCHHASMLAIQLQSVASCFFLTTITDRAGSQRGQLQSLVLSLPRNLVGDAGCAALATLVEIPTLQFLTLGQHVAWLPWWEMFDPKTTPRPPKQLPGVHCRNSFCRGIHSLVHMHSIFCYWILFDSFSFSFLLRADLSQTSDDDFSLRSFFPSMLTVTQPPTLTKHAPHTYIPHGHC